MEKTSAQQCYLRHLRDKVASEKDAAATCSASTALANHLKKKKATITKEAQPQMPSLIDPDTQRRLYEHNTRQLRTAGGLLGTGAGVLGGGGLGAGIGALVSKAGKRLPGAGYGGLIGAAAGGLLGGLTGPGVGQELAGEATQKDIAQLNQLAQQRLIEAGINPFYGDIGVSATFGKNTGDDRPFAIEDYYLKQ